MATKLDGLREYHEPGVIVESTADNLTAVLQIAATMGQERLVTEITDRETQVWDKPQGTSHDSTPTTGYGQTLESLD